MDLFIFLRNRHSWINDVRIFSPIEINCQQNQQKRTKKAIFKNKISCITCHMSHVTCQVSHVLCHVSRVTCHLSLTPTATATEHSPANSPPMHSRLVCKDPQIRRNFKTQKYYCNCKNIEMFRSTPILAIRS